MLERLMLLAFAFLAIQNLVSGLDDHFSDFGYITRRENEWLQSLCGMKKSLCSGVLISRRHVLTSAHCVQYNNRTIDLDHREDPPKNKSMVYMITASPSDLRIVLGDNCASNTPSCKENTTGTREVAKVRRFWTHANYNRYKTSDIAILELESNVNSNKNIMAICLGESPLAINKSLSVYGVGQNGASYDKVYTLQHISVNVVDCFLDPEMIGDNLIHEMQATKELCTFSYDLDRKQALCQGDSGSGLVDSNRDENGRVYVHGIASRGTCKLDADYQNRPDYHIYVRPFISWIARKTGVCPKGHACENEPRSLKSDEDGDLITNGKTRTLYCDDKTWIPHESVASVLCYKVTWWIEEKLNVTAAEEICQEFNAQLAPVRNERELIALRGSVAWSGFKVDPLTETNVVVGGIWDARTNQFKWNIDRSRALRKDPMTRKRLWAEDSGNSRDKDGVETHCTAVRFHNDTHLITEIPCEYETYIVACAKVPESRIVTVLPTD